jgi:hypothetical protein
MQNNSIKQLAEHAQQYLDDWDYVGVRVQTELYGATVGSEIDHESSDWDDGEMLSTKVGGICAIGVSQAKYLDQWGGYDGDFALVLGSHHGWVGEDPAEIILVSPVILEIVAL